MKISRLLVIGLLVSATSPAMAQINPFQGTRTGLTQRDVSMLSASISRLNRTNDLAVGAQDSWSNPSSHSSGQNTVTRIYQDDGLSCHGMRHEFTVKGRKPPRVYNLNWCQASDGSWKIHS